MLTASLIRCHDRHCIWEQHDTYRKASGVPIWDTLVASARSCVASTLLNGQHKPISFQSKMAHAFLRETSRILLFQCS
eukprot:m.166454 g.166454  ORF g.166454 m.166454 type:complete len:78 (-) comp24044_c0_seq1:50-283(-)